MSRGAQFLAFDDRLASAGIPPCSGWWRAELVRFYDHPTATIHTARVGRGGNKSTVTAKCLVFETLFSTWPVPPGERHWAINVSENLAEALARQGQIAEYLSALGVRHERSGEQILLLDLPLGFWTRAARIGATKGPRAIAWSVDEAATLSVEGSNPSEEIVASLKAATITHPNARGRLYSSPFGPLDYHFACVELGDTEEQIVSQAASWIANPDAITEAQARKKEPNPRRFRREYMAIPLAAENAAFEEEDVVRCFGRQRPTAERRARVLIIDPSSAKADAWAWAVAGWSDDWNRFERDSYGEPRIDRWDHKPIPRREYTPHRPWLSVEAIGSFQPEEARKLGARGIVQRLWRVAEKHGARLVISDQREAFALDALFREHGLGFHEIAWTGPNKLEAVEALQRLMADDLLDLVSDDELRRQLIAYEQKITASGSVRFGAPGSQHDDRAALIVTLAMAEAQGLLGGSPFRGPPPAARGVIPFPVI